MAIDIDLKDISEAGFNNYGSRTSYGAFEGAIGGQQRYLKSFDIAGGNFSKNTVIELGSPYIKIDGKNRRIIINDGVNDRILIGYLKDGF